MTAVQGNWEDMVRHSPTEDNMTDQDRAEAFAKRLAGYPAKAANEIGHGRNPAFAAPKESRSGQRVAGEVSKHTGKVNKTTRSVYEIPEKHKGPQHRTSEPAKPAAPPAKPHVYKPDTNAIKQRQLVMASRHKLPKNPEFHRAVNEANNREMAREQRLGRSRGAATPHAETSHTIERKPQQQPGMLRRLGQRLGLVS